MFRRTHLPHLVAFTLALGLSGAAFAAETPPQRAERVQRDREAAALSQADGDYSVPDMEMFPLGAFQPAFDNPKPAKDQSAIGVKHYQWSEDMVMLVRTRHGMVTAITFPPSEVIEAVYLGDSTLFDAQIASPTLIMVTARRPGADTNAIARGRSGNVYNFYIRGEGANSKNVPDMSVFVDVLERANAPAMGTIPGQRRGILPVSTLAPQVASPQVAAAPVAARPPAPAKPGAPEFAREIAFDPSKLVFDLGIYVNDKESLAIKPIRAFRDDVFTYLDFGPNADAVMTQPVVSLVVDGTDTYVGTRVAGPNGNILVVEGVGDLTIRNGAKTVCVKRLPPGETPMTETRLNAELPDATTSEPPPNAKKIPATQATFLGMPIGDR